MTDVNCKFETIVDVHMNCRVIAECFSTLSVLKRLNGRLNLTAAKVGQVGYIDAWMEVADKVPGKLRLYINALPHGYRPRPNSSSVDFGNIKKIFPSLVYLTITRDPKEQHNWVVSQIRDINSCPNMVISCIDCFGRHRVTVEYRPALLNGRHVVDVLREVHSGSSDVYRAYFRSAKLISRLKAKDKDGAFGSQNGAHCSADIIRIRITE